MSTVKANAYLDAAGGNTATINGIIPIAIGDVPASGVQTFTASGSITAGEAVAISTTNNSVEDVKILNNGSFNGVVSALANKTGPSGYYSFGQVVPMSETTYVQVVQSVTSPYPLYAQVNTIADDGTITLGSLTLLVSASFYGFQWGKTVVKTSANKFIVFYPTVNSNVNAVVGSVSGTTITAGAGVNLYATTYYISADSNGSDQVLVCSQNTGAPQGTKIQALTISGTTITAGSATVFYSGTPRWNDRSGESLAYDPSTNRYIFVSVTQASVAGAIYGTVFSASGTTVTVGTTQSLGSETINNTAAYVDPQLNVKYSSLIGRMVLLIGGGLYNPTGTVSSLVISGLSFTRSSQSASASMGGGSFLIVSSSGDVLAGLSYNAIFDPTTYAVALASTGAMASLTYTNYSTNIGKFYINSGLVENPYTARIYGVSNANKVIGLSKDTVTNGQSVNVAVLGGICSSYAGLLVGSKYYVAVNGVISLNATGYLLGPASATTSISYIGN